MRQLILLLEKAFVWYVNLFQIVFSVYFHNKFIYLQFSKYFIMRSLISPMVSVSWVAFSPSPTSNPLSMDRLLSVSLLYFSSVLMLAGYGLHIVVVFILVATGPHPAPPWGATDGGSSGVPVAGLSSTQQRTGTCCFLINWWPGRWWAGVNNKWCYTMQQYWLVPCSCSFFRLSNKE